MKILVDEMPKYKEDCPYAKFYMSDWYCGSVYFCQFHDSNKFCNGVADCPFFTSFKDYQSRTASTIDV